MADLRASSQDFFTRDLDDAVLSGEVDFAVHSAKDMPENIRDGLDWFWLPWREDPRDVIVLRKGDAVSMLPENPIVGVSCERREEYSLKHFPTAKLKSIRGNIEERIAQLDEGNYDILVMAAAGLLRLGLEDRVTEYIPVDELTPPAGQGYLAVTFRKGHSFFEELRKLFVKSVVFAGAGPGNPKLAAVEVAEALKNCEVCLYDALCSEELLKLLPFDAESVFVGKRQGCHSMKQEAICALISDYSRQGKKVVRLKGGDPGIFGRLAEEVDTLNDLCLPYRVIPGISSLSASSTGTGLLLTRRGMSRGFSVMTPRKSGSPEFEWVSEKERLSLPLVFFMGASEIANISKELINERRSSEEPAAVVFSAGMDSEKTICSTLVGIAEEAAKNRDGKQPGILIVGENADRQFLLQNHGALEGKQILLTCSDALMSNAARVVLDFGGAPVCRPLIKLIPELSAENVFNNIDKYNWIVVTSPSAARCMMEIVGNLRIDLRRLPKIMVCGPGTMHEFNKSGIYPDAAASEAYGAEGLIEVARKCFSKNEKALRVRSNLATPGKLLFEAIEESPEIADCVLYRNEFVKYENMPSFDAVVFASASAVNAFVENWGSGALKGKTVAVIGRPTEKALLENSAECKVIVAPVATMLDTIDALALDYTLERLKKGLT